MARKAAPAASTKSTKKSPRTATVVTEEPSPSIASSVSTSTTNVRRIRENDSFMAKFNRDVSARALIVEILGTFMLATVILIANGDPFYSGIGLVAATLVSLGVSGAHLNPAITFGMWTTRSIPALRLAFYWLAQFMGVIAAITLQHLYSNAKYTVSFASFNKLDAKLILAELIGTLVFTYAFTAAHDRVGSEVSKAFGIGFSFTIALVIASGLVASANQAEATNTKPGRLANVTSAVLNPALALELTEKDASASTSMDGSTAPKTTANPVSRLTLETILGPLAGAAIGANLYTLVVSQRSRQRS